MFWSRWVCLDDHGCGKAKCCVFGPGLFQNVATSAISRSIIFPFWSLTKAWALDSIACKNFFPLLLLGAHHHHHHHVCSTSISRDRSHNQILLDTTYYNRRANYRVKYNHCPTKKKLHTWKAHTTPPPELGIKPRKTKDQRRVQLRHLIYQTKTRLVVTSYRKIIHFDCLILQKRVLFVWLAFPFDRELCRFCCYLRPPRDITNGVSSYKHSPSFFSAEIWQNGYIICLLCLVLWFNWAMCNASRRF